ncbi:hypothetical protein ACS0TY_015219 [Phlomoides rotata]
MIDSDKTWKSRYRSKNTFGKKCWRKGFDIKNDFDGFGYHGSSEVSKKTIPSIIVLCHGNKQKPRIIAINCWCVSSKTSIHYSHTGNCMWQHRG